MTEQEKSLLYRQFKETLQQVCKTIEDVTIENTLYAELLIEGFEITRETLSEKVQDALLKPENRQAARKLYSRLWEALEEVGIDAYSEALLRDLPLPDKTN